MKIVFNPFTSNFDFVGNPDTLAQVSAASTDTTKSLYTMTSGVDVEFEDSSNNIRLVINESGSSVLTLSGNINPSADNSYTLGTVQTKEWSSVAARTFTGNNNRMVLKKAEALLFFETTIPLEQVYRLNIEELLLLNLGMVQVIH